MIPEYLTSKCIDNRDVCYNPQCDHAVKVNKETYRYFITMGHCGFNSRINNAMGYATEKAARRAMIKLLVKE